jgi:hypothetical protein
MNASSGAAGRSRGAVNLWSRRSRPPGILDQGAAIALHQPHLAYRSLTHPIILRSCTAQQSNTDQQMELRNR